MIIIQNKVTREYQSLMKLTPTDGILESLRSKNFSFTREGGKRVKMEIMNYHLTLGINIQESNFSTLIISTKWFCLEHNIGLLRLVWFKNGFEFINHICLLRRRNSVFDVTHRQSNKHRTAKRVSETHFPNTLKYRC